MKRLTTGNGAASRPDPNLPNPKPAGEGVDARRLSGRSAIVTGATSGIGLGLARAFAAEGADVLLQGPACGAIDRVCAELRALHGVRVVHAPIDLRSPERIHALAELARERFGKIDIVVNNAGVGRLATAHDPRDGAVAIEVLAAAFHLIRAVVPEMKLRRWGRIINVAAAQCFDASPCRAAYLAARHGMIGLSRAVELDGAAFGVTARTLCFDDELAPPADELFALAVHLAAGDAAHHLTHH